MSAPGRSLRQAVITALVLLALIALCAILGTPYFFALICAVVLVALYELLEGLREAGHRPNVVLSLGCGFALLLVAYDGRPGLIAAVLAAAMFGGFILALRPNRGATPTTDVAWTLLAVGWIGGGGSGAVFILQLDPAGLALLIAFVLVTALDDIGAYFVGTNLGKHKMAPSISPAKSWEGFAGGLITCLIAGVVAGWLVDVDIGGDVFTPLDGLGLGVVCGLLAPVGDLVESMAKREIGIKDSGKLLPGHGGLLDRIDAIAFCAPAAYVYLRFITL